MSHLIAPLPLPIIGVERYTPRNNFETIIVKDLQYASLWMHLWFHPGDASRVRELKIGPCNEEVIPGHPPNSASWPQDESPRLAEANENLFNTAMMYMNGLEIFRYSLPWRRVSEDMWIVLQNHCRALTCLELEQSRIATSTILFHEPYRYLWPVGPLTNLSDLYIGFSGDLLFAPLLRIREVLDQCPRLESFRFNWGCTHALDVTPLLPLLHLPHLQRITMLSIECQPVALRDFFHRHSELRHVELVMKDGETNRIVNLSHLRRGDLPNLKDWWIPATSVMLGALLAIKCAAVPVVTLHNFDLRVLEDEHPDCGDISATLAGGWPTIKTIVLAESTSKEDIDSGLLDVLGELLQDVTVEVTLNGQHVKEASRGKSVYKSYWLTPDKFPTDVGWVYSFTPLDRVEAPESEERPGSDNVHMSSDEYSSDEGSGQDDKILTRLQTQDGAFVHVHFAPSDSLVETR